MTQMESRTPLRLLREAQGLSLETVAERARVTKQQLSEAERGRGGLSIASLYRVAQVLHMDVLASHLAPYIPDDGPEEES